MLSNFRRRPVNMDYAPLLVEASQQHRFDRPAIDGAIAVAALDRFNAHDPCCVAILAA